MLQSPRLTLAIDALLRVYEHVLLDAGAASDLPAELLTSQAQAVVVPEASMPQDARDLMCDQLRAVGFLEVTMLSEPCERRTTQSSQARASWRREGIRRVGRAQRAHHPTDLHSDRWWARRFRAFAHPTIFRHDSAERVAQLLRHLQQRRIVLHQPLGAVEADIKPAASLPRWLSGMKLSKIGSSSLQNSRL